MSLTAPTNTYDNSSAQGTISWTSNNATSAYVSNVGAVNTWGTMSVYMYPYETFTLTLTGPGGTSTCQNTYYPTQYQQPVYNQYYNNGYTNQTPSYYQTPVSPSYPYNYVPANQSYNYNSYNPITYVRNWWHKMGW